MKSLSFERLFPLIVGVMSAALPLAAVAEESATLTLRDLKLSNGLVAAHADRIYSPEAIRNAQPLVMPPAGIADPRYLASGFRELAPAPFAAEQSQEPGEADEAPEQ